MIALDAKGVAQSRITAKRATCLLDESAQIAAEAQAEAEAEARPTATKTRQRKQKSTKDTTSANAETVQQSAIAPQ
ncbi:hypothetical protein GCM10011400_28660 [Paraburkholderia caffeinilytica]|uniref:Uncharacterized protein n=1 Tax=Paraburkholderia caffeinilytica TaxID=1761016 RepID=A0ABQ1MJS4_9BURK|nr:hypothetical protein GCM10011400_28660 [Paraburkholderia caffeinilytica]